MLAANPGYKLYVTGHSLGAALSSIVSFYLALDESIPKPVTCINFASPRVGDAMYLEASTALQASKQLRFLRIVNDNDSLALVPFFNYFHAGYQIRLYKEAAYEPEVMYPKIVDTLSNRWSRTWSNSLFASFNVSYDHGDYRERVEQNKAFLEKMDLNLLYADSSLTGFSWYVSSDELSTAHTILKSHASVADSCCEQGRRMVARAVTASDMYLRALSHLPTYDHLPTCLSIYLPTYLIALSHIKNHTSS